MSGSQKGARPLRVALLCHYPDEETAPAGGVWAVGRNLAAGLLDAGAEVHVVRYRGGGRAGVASVAERLTVHSIELPVRRGLPRQVACVPALAERLRAIRPDAVTAHAPEYALAALRTGLPTAVTVHGMVRQELRVFSGWRQRLPLLLSVWQDWQAARRTQHLVAICHYVIAQYQARTRAIFYRIDVPIGDVFFQTARVAPDPDTLLLVGGMNERKDPLTLLRALALVRERRPGIELRIAGQVGSRGFGARLRQAIEQQGLASHVRFLGALDQPALAQAYAASALTVLSSRQETAPAVLMEAMAACRPVVATDVGGVSEIVADGESGFVVPAGDIRALAERIERILGSPELAQSMGGRGRQVANGRYRRDLVGRRYLALLSCLAGSRTP